MKAYRSREPLEWEWQTADHALDPSLAVVKFIVHLKEMLPSEDWGLIVGDILTNLRAALDHTVYGHIDCKGLITGANRSLLYFPVAQHPNEWPSKQTQLAPLIDSAVLAVIEQHQPYQHQPVAEDVLVVLSSLVNHDKHRALRVITHTSEDFDVKQSDLESSASLRRRSR